MKISKEYFEDKKEQGKIKTALTEAIPVDVKYHNLIMALMDLLKWAISDEYKQDYKE